MINKSEHKNRIKEKNEVLIRISMQKEKERINFLKFLNSKPLNNNKDLIN
jgi:hypothetical protein